jgi:FkbM family methyltransferase
MREQTSEVSLRGVARNVLHFAGLLRPVQRQLGAYHRAREKSSTARLYRQFVRPGDLCFDIGANIGDVSQMMLDLGARVVAVEPQQENVHVLERRFQRKSKIALVPKAVGAAPGTANLMVCSESDCSSLSPDFVAAVTQSGRLKTDSYAWREERTVELTTLDELIATYGAPAFVKIDVEGFEAEVLRGCSQRLRALSFEFTPERFDPAHQCIERLQSLGTVSFNYTVGRTGRLMLREWIDGRNLAHHLGRTDFGIFLGPPGDIYAKFA